jgi:hypothetical protein
MHDHYYSMLPNTINCIQNCHIIIASIMIAKRKLVGVNKSVLPNALERKDLNVETKIHEYDSLESTKDVVGVPLNPSNKGIFLSLLVSLCRINPVFRILEIRVFVYNEGG